MTDVDLEMFMEKLRTLVYENDNDTLFRDNPLIEAKKPEIQLLYEELSHLIGCCFKDEEQQPHDLEDVENWKRRLMEAAQEAEDTIDKFVSSAVIKWDDTLISSYYDSDELMSPLMPDPVAEDNLLDCSLTNLKCVMDDLKSIREEIVMSSNKGNLFQNHLNPQDMMMDEKIDHESAAGTTCSTGNTSATTLSAITHEELIVGFEDDALLILDRLTGDRKKLDIISIVGMGGQGKTTLATKMFNDSLVKHRFSIRGWITVSQAYSKRDLFLQLLGSMGKSVHESASESKLCEMLYQSLKGIRYLIVIDDIWSCKAWDDVGICFPDDKNSSRVLITTRLTEVALHVSHGGFTHSLPHLNEDQSWELLCKKTFRGHECPESLIETGKNIAKKCGGLPLALVVTAGLLEKGEKSKDLWEKIAKSVGSYIIKDPKGCLDTLALSYDHLPCHLKKCFLYVGGFPEDYKVRVRTFIRLWMAEGFIKEAGQRSLEEEGEYYLKDLIDRNLLIVADKSSNGGIKSCRLHDLLRELCLKKAREENFFKKTSNSDSTSSMVKQRRLFTDYEALCKFSSHDFITRTRSVLCLNNNHYYNRNGSLVPSFLLLRVLDLLTIPIYDLSEITMLVHLRYLAVWLRSINPSLLQDGECPFSNAKFRSLQTLIARGKFQNIIYNPDIMVNLRHLRCHRVDFSNDFCAHRVFNLQTISRLSLDHKTQCLLESFSNIRKLGCSIFLASSNHGLINFALLTHLEALNIEMYFPLAGPIRFPETLKRLTLKGLYLPWNYMPTIQQLPKLEVLKLLDSSFQGHLWETGDEQFHQLKFLKLEKLNICFWEASSFNFPRLRKLVVRRCDDLKEIPLGLGHIYTLEHIELDHSNSCVLESVNRIQETQREIGNNDIHVNFNFIDKDPSEVFFEGDPYYE